MTLLRNWSTIHLWDSITIFLIFCLGGLGLLILYFYVVVVVLCIPSVFFFIIFATKKQPWKVFRFLVEAMQWSDQKGKIFLYTFPFQLFDSFSFPFFFLWVLLWLGVEGQQCSSEEVALMEKRTFLWRKKGKKVKGGQK